MRNVIILGSGRSGTSMVTGVLSNAGYFMGNKLWPARDANPKGFFEDEEINEINEDILEPVVPKRFYLRGRNFFRFRPLKWQRWLAYLPLRTHIPFSEDITTRIKNMLQHSPYCFKDPRFCYTLPIWRPYLKNCVFVCVFRKPADTALSILKECRNAPYLNNKEHGIRISKSRALKIWTCMYTHILHNHCSEGHWLFLHYNQVLYGDGLERLTNFTEAAIDYSFPETLFHRSISDVHVSKRTQKIYRILCELAGYQENV